MKKAAVSIALFAGILLLFNILSNRFFFRLDLTEGRQFTLSHATKDILRNLKDPVTVTAYFSENLPPDIAKTRRDFQEMLVEYANISKGKVKFEFVNPTTDDQKNEAAQNGIQPVMINVREKDQVKQQQAFLGALLRMGSQSDPIPFVQPGMAMEYALSTGIKKLSVVDKPFVGVLQGHGEPPLSDLAQVSQELQVLYHIEPVTITSDTALQKYRAVIILAPKDSIPPVHFAVIDNYLSRGGNLVVGINAVNGDLSNAQGTAVTTGLESWLASKGLIVQPQFVIDAQCGSVTLQQQNGFFVINTPVQFPFLPTVSNFTDHPITKGIEQVMFPFASPVNYTGKDGTFTPIATSSARSGLVSVPAFFDFQKKWTSADFPLSGVTVGGVLDNRSPAPYKIVLFGDGDFAVSSQGRLQEDNISLLVNSVDWLSDDTGLIELRTKGVASRPIDQEYLSDDSGGAAKRNLMKALNVGLPILLAILYGLFRTQRQRKLRMKRMEENYS